MTTYIGINYLDDVGIRNLNIGIIFLIVVPDLTSCSAIANATTRTGFAGSQLHRNFSIVSEATAEDFEAIKNASIVGPFLDGCKVRVPIDKIKHYFSFFLF